LKYWLTFLFSKGPREVTKITQRFELKIKSEDEEEDALFSKNFNPGLYSNNYICSE